MEQNSFILFNYICVYRQFHANMAAWRKVDGQGHAVINI